MLEEVKAKCKTQAQRERAEHYFDRYAKKLAEAINQENAIGTRCPSVLIAGASNFPVRKKEKQVAAWEANRANFEKADHYLHLLKTAHVQGVKSNDPEALEYLQAKLARLEAAHDEMKQANAYYRKHKTLDGCPGIPEKAREWLTRPGVFAKGDGTPLALYGCPYPAYALQNSNANIKRIRERLEALKAVKVFSAASRMKLPEPCSKPTASAGLPRKVHGSASLLKTARPPPAACSNPWHNLKRKGRPNYGAAFSDGEKASSLHFLQYNYSIPKTNISNIPNILKNIF
ncbi:MAG: hypothetical protein KH196_12650 [Oscillospiraceae bacterium]|nr:hypothetical protein [Oscillospiraceae bacterium]